jgi:hypothetical protein
MNMTFEKMSDRMIEKWERLKGQVKFSKNCTEEMTSIKKKNDLLGIITIKYKTEHFIRSF